MSGGTLKYGFPILSSQLFIQDEKVQLLGAMDANGQHPFDVGRAAGSTDKG